MMRVENLGVLLLATLCTACKVGPDFEAPAKVTPPVWQEAQQAEMPLLPLKEADLMRWWLAFDDPVLTHLIEQGRSQNPDLRMALARIEQARSEQNAQRADLYPKISANANVARVQNLLPFESQGQSNAFNYFLTGFDAVWEIDVFGRLRRKLEAAEAETRQSAEEYRQAFVVLSAEIARNYFQYRSLQIQEHLLEDNLRLLTETTQLMNGRVQSGLSTRDEALRVAALKDAAQAELRTVKTHLVTTRHQIERLCGQPPNAFKQRLQAVKTFSDINDRKLLTQPADTLRYRPDIRMAEEALHSATATQGAAFAELFPKISVAAFLGLHNSDLENLFKSSAFAWAAGTAVTQPIFNFGKIRAGINLADARQQEALLDYEKRVLDALHECESGLVELIEEEKRRDDLGRTVQDLTEASQLSEARYEAGLETRQKMLASRIAAQQEAVRLVQIKAEVMIKRVALYKALGGGGREPVEIKEEPLRPWG
jgi:NodT family efflux transporter outer membrane factor (OMF) lipoprotein